MDVNGRKGKRLPVASHGRWFSPGPPAYSTTKTGRHDFSIKCLEMALEHQKSIKSIIYYMSSIV
jgi:hypothetical protein